MNTKRALLRIVITAIFFIGSEGVHAAGPWNGTSLNGTTLNNGGWNGTTLNAPGLQGKSLNGLGEVKQNRTAPNAESLKAGSTQSQMIKDFRSNGLRLNAIILPGEQCKGTLPVGITVTR